MKSLARKRVERELARNIRLAAKHFRLSPAAEMQALNSALQSPLRSAACYRAIARSLGA